MVIGIIGSGKMGGNLARLWVRAGYSIYITSNDLDSTRELVKSLNDNIKVVNIEEVITRSEIVLLAIPYEALNEIAQYGNLFSGKVVIDCINPLSPDALTMLVGYNNSAGEEVSRHLPGAKIVKAFNVIASPVLEKDDVKINFEAPSVFYCGDDKESKKTVCKLIEDIGFEPIDSGELKNSRYLEPMAELLIQLAIRGLGANIGFKLLK